MNKIIESFLQIHKKEYSIEQLEESVAFEHFVNKIIVNKYSCERFDPNDVMTDEGEKGLDGVAICINNRLITTEEELSSIYKDEHKLDVKFIFIQSKTGNSFDGEEIGSFLYGVKAFFAPAELRPRTNEKMEELIALKDAIYSYSLDMDNPPTLELYYVCCGRWNDGNGLMHRVKLEIQELEKSQNFSCINFFPYDSEKIITSYKELKKKVSRTFIMEKKVTFPSIDGVKQAFLGLVKCTDFVTILLDSDNKMLTNIFEDNVRDFQGYNNVNREIQETLQSIDDQPRFGLLNNGITIVAKSITSTGDSVEIYDYQIVNGCQTSYILFDNKKCLSSNAYVVVKLIEVNSEDIADRVIYTTNRQTEVKSEAFVSTKPFHKRLQDFYNAIPIQYRLYYERRSKQYDLDDSISKNKVVTVTQQIQSYLAMFLNEPQSTHRYYGELLRAYNNKLFLKSDDYDAYFCAAYFNYYVDRQMRTGKLDKKYKRFRFHIICAMRILIAGSIVAFGQNKVQRKICEKLWKTIEDEQAMQRIMSSAVTCVDGACYACKDVANSDKHRSKEVTLVMIELAEKQVQAIGNKKFLKKGDVVHCTVTAVRRSFVNVSIKCDDSRNYGSIHISKFAKRYIENLFDEVKIGQIFQAQIVNDDFYEHEWGWDLSKI